MTVSDGGGSSGGMEQVLRYPGPDTLAYFLDTEFIEDGETIDLISIGVVCEDGREFYRCNTKARLYRADLWVRENVLPQLPGYADPAWWSVFAEDPRYVTKSGDGRTPATPLSIADELRCFVWEKPKPVFWAYYADYDWVALCRCFGRMLHLPAHFPRYCMDLKQLAVMLGNPTLPAQTSGEHNALADAHWNHRVYEWLRNGVP